MLELVVVVFVIVGVDVDVVVVVVVLEVILLALEASCAGIRCEMCLRMEVPWGRAVYKDLGDCSTACNNSDGQQKFRRPSLSGAVMFDIGACWLVWAFRL